MISSSRDAKWGSLVLTGQGSRVTHIVEQHNAVLVGAVQVAPKYVTKVDE